MFFNFYFRLALDYTKYATSHPAALDEEEIEVQMISR